MFIDLLVRIVRDNQRKVTRRERGPLPSTRCYEAPASDDPRTRFIGIVPWSFKLNTAKRLFFSPVTGKQTCQRVQPEHSLRAIPSSTNAAMPAHFQ
jgi:hypothetical protein